MKTHTRYIASKFLTHVLFLFIGFGGTYALIEYSANIRPFLRSSASFLSSFGYLLSCYLMRFDFFVPLSIVLGAFTTIISLKKRFELVAFQAGGISLKRLYAPITWTGILAIGATLLFYEYGYPLVVETVDTFQQSSLKKGLPTLSTPRARSVQLDDGTTIFFTHQDRVTGHLADVFILPNGSDIWHCGLYAPEEQIGYRVQKIAKMNTKYSIEEESLDQLSFNGIVPALSARSWSKRFHKSLSLSKLYEKKKLAKQLQLRNHFESTLYFKLSISLFSLLFLPLIYRATNAFSRNENAALSLLLLFALFIASYMGLLSLKILGQEGLVPIGFSFSLILILFAALSVRRFAKT